MGVIRRMKESSSDGDPRNETKGKSHMPHQSSEDQLRYDFQSSGPQNNQSACKKTLQNRTNPMTRARRETS
jgi:hypothetical protein